jgi:hypothetical protein
VSAREDRFFLGKRLEAEYRVSQEHLHSGMWRASSATCYLAHCTSEAEERFE